jgi:hypothetical protein
VSRTPKTLSATDRLWPEAEMPAFGPGPVKSHLRYRGYDLLATANDAHVET